MSTNTTTTKNTALAAEVVEAIAENPYCGYALHIVLTQDGLREKIKQIIKKALDEVYKSGEWEDAYDNAHRILNRGSVDEDPEEYEEDFVELHYTTLYDYCEEWPLKATEIVAAELEKIGFIWVDVTEGDDLFEAFQQIDENGKHTRKLYGKKMDYEPAHRTDGFESFYEAFTPKELLDNWVPAIDDLIDDLWDVAEEPFEEDED